MMDLDTKPVNTTVFGLFADERDVTRAIHALLAAGFPQSEIDHQDEVMPGRSLLTVHGSKSTEPIEPAILTIDWIRTAKDILDRCGAESIAAAREANSAGSA